MEHEACPLAHGIHADGRCGWCGSPLSGSAKRRWCTPACQRAWSVNHIWGAARIEALTLAGGRCERCGDPEDLEVHHDPPVGSLGYGHGCQHHQANLTVLCVAHHVEAHALLRAAPGTITQLSLLAA